MLVSVELMPSISLSRRKRLVERRQIAVLELGDEIPAAVGAVERPHLGHAAQPLRDMIGGLALHLDQHDGPDLGLPQLRAEPDREGLDDAVGDHAVDARLDRGARNARRGREAGHGKPRILAQEADEPAVEIVHEPAILSISLIRMYTLCDQIASISSI